MGRSLARVLIAAQLSTVLAPATVFAQAAPPPPQPYAVSPTQPPPGYVPLLLQGATPGLSYELTPDQKNAAPIAGCPGDCLVYVPPGKYRLTVGETAETRSGKRTIEVFYPTRAFVEPRTKSDKEAGLLMGIGGSLMVVGGIVGLAVSLTENTHCASGSTLGSDGRNCKTDWTTGSTVSLLVLVAGAVLSPIGWVQLGRSAPTVTATPLAPFAPAAAPPPKMSFDVVPLRKSDTVSATSLAGGLLVGTLAF